MGFLEKKNNIVLGLKKAELYLPKKPNHLKKLQLPEDITKLSDKQLGQYLGYFSAACNYAHRCFAVATYKVNYFERVLRTQKAMLNIKTTGKNYERRDKIAVHPKIKKLERLYEQANAEMGLIETIYESYERSEKLMSREISRREILVFGERRRVK